MFGTVAARFNDDGVTAVYQHLRELLRARGAHLGDGLLEPATGRFSTQIRALVPPSRVRYLADVADAVRALPRRDRRAAGRAAPARRAARGRRGRARRRRSTPRSRAPKPTSTAA